MSKPIRPLLFEVINGKVIKSTWTPAKKPNEIWTDFKACYSSGSENLYWIVVHPDMDTIQINWKMIIRSTNKISYPNPTFKQFLTFFD